MSANSPEEELVGEEMRPSQTQKSLLHRRIIVAVTLLFCALPVLGILWLFTR